MPDVVRGKLEGDEGEEGGDSEEAHGGLVYGLWLLGG